MLGATLIAWSARPAVQPTVRVQQSLDQTIQPAPEPVQSQVDHAVDQTADHGADEGPDGDGGTRAVGPRARGVLRLIHANGGSLTGPQRELASRLGVPQSTLNRVLAEARAAGLLDVSTGQTGTVVKANQCPYKLDGG